MAHELPERAPELNASADMRDRLRLHPMFSEVASDALDGIVADCQLEEFAPGDGLLRQGDRSDDTLFLVTGQVEVSVDTAQGPVLLARLDGDQLFGEISVFTGLSRTATVRAVTEGQMLRIRGPSLLQAGERHPSILRHVIGELGSRLEAFNRATGFYTNALAALEHPKPDATLVEDLFSPPPELVNFAAAFRKLAGQIVQRQAQREEMANAAAIQRALLPLRLPDDAPRNRLDLHVHLESARDVGGDFYDAFALDENRMVVVVGDVSGKGVPASLFMAVCRTLMRVVLRQIDDLGLALGRANDLVEADSHEAMFTTFVAMVLDLATGRLTYCNGGHPPPILTRVDGTVEILPLTSLPLGIVQGGEYAVRTLVLAPDDAVLIYTDGVTEAENPDGDLFGDARLRDAVEQSRGLPSGAVVDGVLGAVGRFVDGALPSDDITCLALRYKGQGPN